MKKLLAILLALTLLTTVLIGCKKDDGNVDQPTATPATDEPTGGSDLEGVTLRIGATPAPHAEILEVVRDILAEQGVKLEIVEFDDYILPNTALEEGDLHANYFQHITYMNNFNEEHGTHLISVADVHYEPFAIYAGKADSIEGLEPGSKIAVPDDGTNEARALLLLESQGLITLNEGVGLSATKLDIADNPNNYDIVEMEAKLLPQVLQDVELAVINGNYALGAGLTEDQALVFELESEATLPYVNVLAIKEGNENDEAIMALVDALLSTQVKNFITETYGNAVKPVF